MIVDHVTVRSFEMCVPRKLKLDTVPVDEAGASLSFCDLLKLTISSLVFAVCSENGLSLNTTVALVKKAQ